MTEAFRLPGAAGALLRFTFDGRPLTGRAGDTVASALLANGVHLVGRSFKYHRPRGIVAAGAEEPNAIVAIGRGARLDTNTQATRVPLTDGLEVRSLNAWPSLRWDAGAVLGAFGRFLPAGFYYKTFFRPSWHAYERPIRRIAGLGTAPDTADPDRYEHMYSYCDVMIVGAGVAGLAAARAAARRGADVILAEQEDDAADPSGAPDLAGMPNVRVMRRTSVAAYHDHGLLLAAERPIDAAARQRLWWVRAAQVVLATGAFERPLVFPGNDRPGIMLASAILHYAERHRVAAGRRVVFVTNDDEAYAVASTLRATGIDVAAIVDARAAGPDGPPGVAVHRGAVVTATYGRRRVRAVAVTPLAGGRGLRIACDTVGMAGGRNPALQLFSQSGGTLRWDEACAAFLPATAKQATHVAGAAAGLNGIEECRASGEAAGERAARGEPPLFAAAALSGAVDRLWSVPDRHARGAKQWVDFHNDVTSADVALAAREGFRSVEHLKRYTTLGMAPDQGKTSNVNGLAILGTLTGRTPGDVGTTTFRPPFTPISFGAIGGRGRGPLFHPMRRLPTDRLQAAHGAHMEDYGAWLRPSHYPKPGEDMAAAIAREVRAVRTGVGILDYSPLGKIEVAGPDAADLLGRIVATDLATLKPGRLRYALMLNEQGVMIEDGVAARLAEDRFLLGTGSGGAERIFRTIDEWHQVECPGLDVSVADLTTAEAVVMLTGPQARTLLARTGIDIDLSPAAMPHMTVREGRIGAVSVRVSRVSFTGEVSFEVALPWGHAAALWERLFTLGADLAPTPIGIEALDVLRIEKGFLHVGGDTDGTTTPDDAGYGAMIARRTSDFIGRRSLALPEARRPGRLQYVGMEPIGGTTPLAVGTQLIDPAAPARASGLGLVTSSVWSPTLGRPVALGLCAGGRDRIGAEVDGWHDRGVRRIRITAPHRYDPEGSRLRD